MVTVPKLERQREHLVDLPERGVGHELRLGVVAERHSRRDIAGAVAGHLGGRDRVPFRRERLHRSEERDVFGRPIRKIQEELGGPLLTARRTFAALAMLPPIPAPRVHDMEHQQQVVDPAPEVDSGVSEEPHVGRGGEQYPAGLVGTGSRTAGPANRNSCTIMAASLSAASGGRSSHSRGPAISRRAWHILSRMDAWSACTACIGRKD